MSELYYAFLDLKKILFFVFPRGKGKMRREKLQKMRKIHRHDFSPTFRK